MNKYITPDFDVTIYEIEDVITDSTGSINIGVDDPDGDSNWEWYG